MVFYHQKYDKKKQGTNLGLTQIVCDAANGNRDVKKGVSVPLALACYTKQ